MENKEKKQPEKEKKSNVGFIIIILILLAGCGVLGWLYWEQKQQAQYVMAEKTNIEAEKKAVEAELTDMLAEYENLETENTEIKGKIEDQQEKIKDLLAEVEKHKDDAYKIYKLRKEARTLRDIMKGYVHTIDSLNILNRTLQEEKEQITEELVTQQEKYTELEEVKKDLAGKVKVGSRMNAVDMFSVAQRVRSNGVHKETNRNQRAEKIKVCFTLDKNEIAEPGAKNIFIRIISPDGKVFSEGEGEEYKFKFNGGEGLYSMKKQVIYENEELDVCTYYDLQSEPAEGKYIVEAYHDEAKIGTATFELK